MRPLVFIDESGDHNLKNGGDPNYPVFVLVAVIIDEHTYHAKAIPKFKELKEEFFGDPNVILHENPIRKGRDQFAIFRRDPSKKEKFLARIDTLLTDLDFKLVASIIDKRRLIQNYKYPKNPYDLALQFVLERVHMELRPKSELQIILESRGKREDRELSEVFKEICNGGNYAEEQWPFLKAVFKRKQDNEVGLQIADLVARPIGRWYLDQNQKNRAYETIKKKFRRSQHGVIVGYGLKIFPEEPFPF